MMDASADSRGLPRIPPEVVPFSDGQNRYLIKPFGLDEILTQIRDMAGGA